MTGKLSTAKLPTANCQPPTANRQLKVVAAIPCFNTEPFIADVVTKAKKYVDQVIVVDDGSTDGTAEAAKAAGATVISHGMNKGYREATKSCFAAAKANAADVLVTLDGDGQHNPDEIPSVLSPVLNKEADLVIGSRFLQPEQSVSQQSTVTSSPPQPPTRNSRLSTARLSTVNSELPTANSQLPTANSELPTPNCQLPTANCRPCPPTAPSESALSPLRGTLAPKQKCPTPRAASELTARKL